MLVHTGGGQNNDFGAGAQTDFILGLVSSVVQAGTTHICHLSDQNKWNMS